MLSHFIFVKKSVRIFFFCVSNMKFCVDYDLLVSLTLNCPSVLRFLCVISVVLSVQIHLSPRVHIIV
jgi:hypothetical protein